MNQLPLISVCLITYNHKNYIGQSIESVLMQKTSFRWELIIADDYSTDGTRDILLDYQRKYPDLINLILQEHNVGAARNWMMLMERPTSKYVAYLEGDDYWIDPLKLQKQVDVLESNDTLSIAAHGAYKLTDKLSLIDSPFKTDTIWSTKDILINDWFIMSASLVFRRSMMDLWPGWITEVSNGDLALILTTSLNGDGFYSPEPMSVYRITGEGVMSRFNVKDSEKYILLMDYFNKASDYKFDKEIAVLKKRNSIDVLHQYLSQASKTNILTLKFWKSVTQALRWAKITQLPYVIKRIIYDNAKQKKLKDRIFNDKLIYDVGLHNGDDTEGYLKKGFKVISIEADPILAQKAQKKFHEYISKDRLKILNIGVAPEEGEFDFYINEEKSEWNSFDLSIASRDGLPWHAIKVKALPFEKIIAQHGIPYYLKVDIEGHDYLCIRGVNKDDLPKYMSVEVNDISLIYDLANKGFTRFKMIFQYNLAHLDLPPNKFFKRWLWAYKLRQWDSFSIKVFRKLGGSGFITWIDKLAKPGYSKKYKKGSSGSFGEDVGGEWYDLEKTIAIYNYYYNLFHHLPNKKDYGFWVDVHASW